jgi:hypothetical protein
MIGCRVWAIPEGFIPGRSFSQERELVSHEACCILNAGGAPAHIKPTLISRIVSRRDPIESRLRRGERCIFASTISSTRSPFRDTAYASVVRSDAPIVVQHTRLDSRDPHTALLSTIAFPIA